MSPAMLVIDDEPATSRALQRALTGWRCMSRPAGEPGRGEPAPADCDLVFAARIEPEAQTVELLRDLRARSPRVPVVLLGGESGGHAVALRAGAFDYLRKPLELDAVALTAQRAIEWRLLEVTNQRLEQALLRLRQGPQPDGQDPPQTSCAGVDCAVRDRLSLRELKDRYVESILTLTAGNKMRAAEILGIDRRTLYRRESRERDGDRS